MSLALVTGATGFIGGQVAADLLARGWAVRPLVRPESLGSGGCRAAASRRRRPARRRGLRRARGASTPSSTSRPRYSLARARAGEIDRTNIEGTATSCRGGRRGRADGAPSSVSTIGLPADGTPGDEDTPLPPGQVIGAYKRSKVASERLALDAAAAGQHVVVVNPTAPVGPGDHAQRRRAASSPTSWPAGCRPTSTPASTWWTSATSRRPPPRAGARRPRRRYILGNENMTLREILRVLAGLSGRRPPRVRLPHAVAIAAAAVDEAVEGRLLGREPLAPLDGALMARKRMFVNGSRAVRELGMPQSPVRQALADAIDWARAREAA